MYFFLLCPLVPLNWGSAPRSPAAFYFTIQAKLRFLSFLDNTLNKFKSFLQFSTGITLIDVHLNWLNWFHFVIFEGGLLVILIDCMIFLDAIRTFMSTVSFLAQLGWNSLPIECFRLTYIKMAVSLELTETF